MFLFPGLFKVLFSTEEELFSGCQMGYSAIFIPERKGRRGRMLRHGRSLVEQQLKWSSSGKQRLEYQVKKDGGGE